MRFEQERTDSLNRRQAEAEGRRRAREIDEVIQKADGPSARENDDYPESRLLMRQYYQDARDCGCMPAPESQSVHHYAYPGIEITPQGDAYGSYDDLRHFLKSETWSGLRSGELVKVEAHHLLRDDMMKHFGIAKGEGLCVAIYSDEHMQLVHGPEGIEAELPRTGQRVEAPHSRQPAQYDIWEVVDGHVRAYEAIGRPEWAEKVRDYVRQNQDRILEAYTNGSLQGVGAQEIHQARSFLRTL